MSISQTDGQTDKHIKSIVWNLIIKRTLTINFILIFLSTRTISLYRKVVECNIECEKVSENFKKFHIVSGRYNS
jgi:hypothetical protein